MQTSSFTAKDLNDGFVVAINIEAKAEEAETVAAILESLVKPTMAEPGSSSSFPIGRRPRLRRSSSSSFTSMKGAGAPIRRRRISRRPSGNSCPGL